MSKPLVAVVGFQHPYRVVLSKIMGLFVHGGIRSLLLLSKKSCFDKERLVAKVNKLAVNAVGQRCERCNAKCNVYEHKISISLEHFRKLIITRFSDCSGIGF